MCANRPNIKLRVATVCGWREEPEKVFLVQTTVGQKWKNSNQRYRALSHADPAILI